MQWGYVNNKIIIPADGYNFSALAFTHLQRIRSFLVGPGTKSPFFQDKLKFYRQDCLLVDCRLVDGLNIQAASEAGV